MFETTLKLLEEGYYEAKFAFEGLADENVWKRPHPKLLSVGELAGHMAYWEAIRLAGDGEDLSRCKIASPLIDSRFRYYTTSLGVTLSADILALTAEEVYAELIRVHQEAIAHLKSLNPDPTTPIPGCPTGFTYGQYLEYAIFHTAYHVGQIYSVRHMLGEETPDN